MNKAHSNSREAPYNSRVINILPGEDCLNARRESQGCQRCEVGIDLPRLWARPRDEAHPRVLDFLLQAWHTLPYPTIWRSSPANSVTPRTESEGQWGRLGAFLRRYFVLIGTDVVALSSVLLALELTV